MTFIDPNAMNIGNNVQQRPCIPTKLSPAAMELVRLYEQLHAFKDDPEFIRVGFAVGPYSAWLQAIERHRDTNSGLELLDELGFIPGDVLLLGMNYLGEDISESDLLFIEDSERKIQAGLALTRCAEPETAVQDIARASAEARRAYVPSVDRPPAGADDIDERVINPCIAAGAAQNDLGDIDPWTLRNVYPEKFDPVEAQMRALADGVLALAETELPEFGARARNIILDRLRDDCIRGARGEETLDWSEAEVRELLSISQEEATQYELPLLNVNGEPYFPGERCDSPWVEHTPIASWMDPFDTGWLCESRLPRSGSAGRKAGDKAPRVAAATPTPSNGNGSPRRSHDAGNQIQVHLLQVSPTKIAQSKPCTKHAKKPQIGFYELASQGHCGCGARCRCGWDWMRPGNRRGSRAVSRHPGGHDRRRRYGSRAA